MLTVNNPCHRLELVVDYRAALGKFCARPRFHHHLRYIGFYFGHMRKIIIALAFLLTATLSNAQQADTIKTPLALSHIMEFGHTDEGDRYYVLYRIHDKSMQSVKVYCASEDFFDILVWKSDYSGVDCETQMEIVYVAENREYILRKKDTGKKGEA